jgi:hypothetical protein
LLTRAVQLVSIGRGTIASLGPDGASCGPRTAAGDGVVPGLSAVEPGVRSHLLDSPHDQMMADRDVVRAVVDLLRTGKCQLPLVTTERLREGKDLLEPALMELREGAQASVQQRLSAGLLRTADLDWLTAHDHSRPPGR